MTKDIKDIYQNLSCGNVTCVIGNTSDDCNRALVFLQNACGVPPYKWLSYDDDDSAFFISLREHERYIYSARSGQTSPKNHQNPLLHIVLELDTVPKNILIETLKWPRSKYLNVILLSTRYPASNLLRSSEVIVAQGQFRDRINCLFNFPLQNLDQVAWSYYELIEIHRGDFTLC